MRVCVQCAVFGSLLSAANAADNAPIDRQALVTRHNLDLTTPGRVQVGNGEFAFTADLSGLQTVEDCCTMSQWGWHSSPLPEGKTPKDFQWTAKQSYCGRSVDYMAGTGDDISKWLYANPHRMNLGRIRLLRAGKDAPPIKSSDIVHPHQSLDLWTGILESHFELDGQPVGVVTCAHPARDAVAVRIESRLISERRLQVELAFPYPDLKEFGGYGNWNQPDAHQTVMSQDRPNQASLERTVDADTYSVTVSWNDGASFAGTDKEHRFILAAGASNCLEFVCQFDPRPDEGSLPSFAATHAASSVYWRDFWKHGGAMDLSGSTDPRAKELERRIILSQYLTAVNCAGSLPPQESGLFNNGWNGKFHMEMYWWHGAHYALWDRWPLLERSLDIYLKDLPSALEKAARQGYKGARWPKCTGPDGRESPHPIHAMLLWQQPHPIFFAELDYRAHPIRNTLNEWGDIVMETADFMASFAVHEKDADRYVLGPPIYTVPETTDPDKVYNPAFELAYWRYALEIAQQWRERMDLPRDPEWDTVLHGLAPLPVQDGVYLLEEHLPDSYTKWNHNHPSVAGIYGILPGAGVDRDTMKRTLDKVMDCWNWKDTWGWDFPMLAMTAARLGEPDRAVDLLLHKNFGFDERGYPVGGGPEPYFPSSGGMLYAAAFMAGGWDGAPAEIAPGFPKNEAWKVHVEGLKTAP
jgi:hypothetical protein